VPLFVTDALVLRKSEYRDYDRMLTLFTPEYGRIDAVAYGCKRAKSPLMNAAEVFCAGEYTLKRRAERYAVEQCQIHQNFYALREDYERLTCGVYMLHQLLFAALPGEGNARAFRLALDALTHLCFSDLPSALVTFAFEMHYQAALGEYPRVDGCVQCGRAPVPDAFFDAARGGVVCPDCAAGQPPISYMARRILLKAPRAPFAAVQRLEEAPQWREAAAMMRKFVAYRTDPPPKQWPSL
jgi:DNA repair protein RecO (recombination protein O)